MTRFAVIGASGLIGRHLVGELLTKTAARIVLVTRRPLGYSDARIEEKIIDVSDEDSWNRALEGADAVFVAVGTTQKKVKGDLAAYRKVDHDIPLAAARACVTNHIPSFLLVSSVGADSRSRNFYLRIKGEVEDALEGMLIPSVSIIQPSLLLGDRTEFRLGERISQLLLPLISFLIPTRYRPVSAAAVAKAMLRAALERREGVTRYQYDAIRH